MLIEAFLINIHLPLSNEQQITIIDLTELLFNSSLPIIQPSCQMVPHLLRLILIFYQSFNESLEFDFVLDPIVRKTLPNNKSRQMLRKSIIHILPFC